MYNVEFQGIYPYFEPLSSSFTVDIINEEIVLKERMLRLNKISYYVESHIIDTFNSLDKNFIVLLLNINMRFDYIGIDKFVNYEIFTIHKLINICTGDDRVSTKHTVYSYILDSGVCNIDDFKVNLYIVFTCSL